MHGQAVAGNGASAIREHRPLRETGDLLGHRLGGGPGLAAADDLLAKPDPQRLLRLDLAAGHDDLERPALADEAGQTDRAAIDQGDAPAPAIDAEIGVMRHHPDIAPERELHAAGHGRSLDRRDQRLVHLQPRRAHRSTRRRSVALGKGEALDDLALEASGIGEGLRIFQVPAGAEGTAFAPEHDRGDVRVGVELPEGLRQRDGAVRVHGIACLGAAVDHGRDLAFALDADGHAAFLPGVGSDSDVFAHRLQLGVPRRPVLDASALCP